MSNFKKFRPVGGARVPCGRTDMTKLTVAFRNFANGPKDGSCQYLLPGMADIFSWFIQQFSLCINLLAPELFF